MSDTTIKKTRVNGVVYDLGGAGSGAQIVDALPAEGEEGSVYLLRKSTKRPGGFTARGYAFIQGDPNFVFVTNDFTVQDLRNEIYTKLHIDLSSLPEYINIGDLEEFLDSVPVVTEEEFNQRISDFAIVETEEDLPSTDPGKLLLQDLGEITVDSFEFSQVYVNNSNESFVYLEKVKDSLVLKTEVDNSTFVVMTRNISYGDSNKLIIGEWTEEELPIAESLVDQIITDLNVLQQLGDNIAYIKCSPSPVEYDYSYTEYVFDQGVYTEITASGGGKTEEDFTVGDLYEYCSNKDISVSETMNVYHYNVDKYSEIFYKIMNFLKPIEREQGTIKFIHAGVYPVFNNFLDPIVGFTLGRDGTGTPVSNYLNYIVPASGLMKVISGSNYPTIQDIIDNFEQNKSELENNTIAAPLYANNQHLFALGVKLIPRIYIYASVSNHEDQQVCLGHIDITVQDILDLIDKTPRPIPPTPPADTTIQ